MQNLDIEIDSLAIHPASIFAAPILSVTLGLIALDVLIAFESMAVTTVMPVIATALNGLSDYALAFSIATAASILGLVSGGRWSDDSGPHRSMSIGLLAFVSGLIVAGLSTGMAYFLVGRALQGFGGGAVTVAIYVIVARHYPAQLHPRVFAALSAAWVVPSLVGPAVAGWIAQHWNWRYVFLGAAGLAIPCVMLLWPSLRGQDTLTTVTTTNDKHRLDNQPSIWNTWLAALSLGTIGIVGQRHDALGIMLVGAVGIVAWYSTARLMPKGMNLAARGLPTVIIMRGAVAAAFFGTEAFIPLMLTQQRAASVAYAGIALTVGALGWSLGAWFQRDARIDRVLLVRLGSLSLLCGILTSAAVLYESTPTFVAMIGWAIAGLGMGILSSSLSLLVLQLSAVEVQGRNSAAMRLMDSSCTTAVLAIAGTLFGLLSPAAPALAFLFVFAFMLLCAIVALALAGRTAPLA